MNVRREPDLWLLYLPRVSEEYPRQKLTDLEIVPCPVKRGKKATIKTLVRACTSYAGNTVLISRKDGCNVQASGCPMTCGLTCCLSTGEFAEVITSIILLPGQPHNTQTWALMSHREPWGSPAWQEGRHRALSRAFSSAGQARECSGSGTLHHCPVSPLTPSQS